MPDMSQTQEMALLVAKQCVRNNTLLSMRGFWGLPPRKNIAACGLSPGQARKRVTRDSVTLAAMPCRLDVKTGEQVIGRVQMITEID